MSICQAGLDNEKPLYSGFALNTAAFPYLRFLSAFPMLQLRSCFPALVYGAFQVLGLLEYFDQRDELFLESLS